jgi:hypothetical protein
MPPPRKHTLTAAQHAQIDDHVAHDRLFTALQLCLNIATAAISSSPRAIGKAQDALEKAQRIADHAKTHPLLGDAP